MIFRLMREMDFLRGHAMQPCNVTTPIIRQPVSAVAAPSPPQSIGVPTAVAPAIQAVGNRPLADPLPVSAACGHSRSVAPRLPVNLAPPKDPRLRLGERLGSGTFGEAYVDKYNPDFVIKRHLTEPKRYVSDIARAQKEVDSFNKFYGSDAARIFRLAEPGAFYTYMRRVPGIPLWKITDFGVDPSTAQQALLDMVIKMHDVGITHSDLHGGNVLWDKASQTFFPIDILDYPYLELREEAKKKISLNDVANWNRLQRKIENPEVPYFSGRESSSPEGAGCVTACIGAFLEAICTR
jgi:hypothetical protein